MMVKLFNHLVDNIQRQLKAMPNPIPSDTDQVKPNKTYYLKRKLCFYFSTEDIKSLAYVLVDILAEDKHITIKFKEDNRQ